VHTLGSPFLHQITVQEFAELRKKLGTKLQLIDVRESEELLVASLEGFIHLPLSHFEQWSGQISVLLDPSVETVVMCHHGVRSAQMCYWLINQGFLEVKNLLGGIDAYSRDVDPTVPQY
jgi:rhodanese-related sulfurtransferase